MAKAKAKEKKQPFNVKAFLSTVDGGRTVTAYRKNAKIFSQATRRILSFIFRKARSRSASSPNWVRKRSSPPARRGFGTRVMEGMIGQMNGDIRFDWRIEGLACEITIPT